MHGLLFAAPLGRTAQHHGLIRIGAARQLHLNALAHFAPTCCVGKGVPVERRNSNVRSARICATICTTPSPALIFRRHFSICCSRSESAASCSRPTTLTAQWPRHARFWNRFRFPPPTVRGSLMVTRRVCSDFERSYLNRAVSPSLLLSSAAIAVKRPSHGRVRRGHERTRMIHRV